MHTTFYEVIDADGETVKEFSTWLLTGRKARKRALEAARKHRDETGRATRVVKKIEIDECAFHPQGRLQDMATNR